ncbi:diaminobutyrate--2-oxoglutarate transaminase [Methylocapsa palsarum]|uniref:Diaminobutyrate-2-oxoglutarate transaminase n=1 Tax=Methylocapsa palsarum TaxID=1612308 RepID=A0A1I4AQC1_9HYPH|nr:diaminobutyrate--2-oxoglutarate transaminase [Methylocapsa palsarum]SFK58137.1 diaminobutyrate-2-oxoglutarate transaminase [Methylocapsa palsarum]
MEASRRADSSLEISPSAAETGAARSDQAPGSEQDKKPAARSSASYLERQNRIESNARSYPRRLPIALKSGRGVRVVDVDGREYIDCLSGAGSLALGHSHPEISEALHKALLDEAPLQTLDLPTPLKERFIDELIATLPDEFAADARIQFCGPSGADAIEAALKLVKTATGRRGVLCFHGSYHGMTSGALGLTGAIAAKAAVGLSAESQFLPFPSDYRCPFGLGGTAGATVGAAYIETLLDDPNSGVCAPAAVILEIVQGEGGINPAPDDWLRAVRAMTSRRGIPLIIDEVQTGLGRTGRLFAFERAGVRPDVVVLSKAIGGGLPLSVVVYHRDLDVWKPGAHAGTFRGNQLAFAAGAAAIRHVRAHRLDLHAEAMGQRLMAALDRVAATKSSIGNVRGRGLMIGVEFVESQNSAPGSRPPPAHPAMARHVQAECLRRGLIVELGGRFGAVVRFLPPLIVSANEIDEIAARFEDAVAAAQSRAATASRLS